MGAVEPPLVSDRVVTMSAKSVEMQAQEAELHDLVDEGICTVSERLPIGQE
jgi:hypothetical protein